MMKVLFYRTTSSKMTRRQHITYPEPRTPWPALQDSSTLIWGTFWQAWGTLKEFLYQYEQWYKQMTWYSVKIMIHTLSILHSVGPYPTVITRAIVCDIPAKTSASPFFSLGDIRLYPLLLSVIYVLSVAGNWRNFGFVIQRKWKWVTTMWNTPSDRICSVLTACALVDSSDWDSTDGSRQLHTDNWDTMSHHAISLEFKPK